MERGVSRRLELGVFAASLVLPAALLAYSWFMLGPPEAGGDIAAKVQFEIPEVTSGVECLPSSAEVWPEGAEEPWLIVVKEVEVIPPADIAVPEPELPAPPTPLPDPGPAFEHTENLPEWGDYPGGTP